MPRFEVRLEAQDGSGHFRQTSGYFPDKKAAQRHCERMELRRALFTLDAEQAADLCERYGVTSVDELPKAAPRAASDAKKAPFRELKPQDRSRLHAHYQEQPYKVVSVELSEKGG